MKKIVLVSGGFDPLHSGHLAYFNAAKQLGDELWVGVNSDAWLTRKKGSAFMSFFERSTLIENLQMVDQVLSFEDDDIGSSNCCIEKILELTGMDTKIIVANGGDRNIGNIPEVIKYGNHPRVEFAWSVGGDDKKNSSSWILDSWKNQKTDRPWGYWRVLDDKETIKVKDCIVWDMPKIYDSFESVKTATNGEIFDEHFSFKGHKQFAEYMENIINKKIL
jgi:D-beta-D-heptose 7-phosphate kinase/D-beta-D-heptose 1-phosphate adenosyltransferase